MYAVRCATHFGLQDTKFLSFLQGSVVEFGQAEWALGGYGR